MVIMFSGSENSNVMDKNCSIKPQPEKYNALLETDPVSLDDNAHSPSIIASKYSKFLFTW